MHASTRFKELGYQYQPIDMAVAVQAAVTVFQELLSAVPSVLPYVAEPSAVLLFAGLRAISPYHRLGEEVSRRDQKKFEAVLSRHGMYTWTNNTAYEEDSSNTFSLVNSTIFDAIPEHYRFCQSTWKSPISYSSTLSGIEWMYVIEHALAQQSASGILPKEWLSDWWAPQNLLFGMLLGYPGEAISASLWRAANVQLGQEEAPAIEILVANGEPYFGAHVSFDVSPELVSSPSIKYIKQLWSEVVAGVYQAMPLHTLLLNEDFARSYRMLEHDNQ